MTLDFSDQRGVDGAVRLFVMQGWGMDEYADIQRTERLGDSEDSFWVTAQLRSKHLFLDGVVHRIAGTYTFFPSGGHLLAMIVDILSSRFEDHEKKWPHAVGI